MCGFVCSTDSNGWFNLFMVALNWVILHRMPQYDSESDNYHYLYRDRNQCGRLPE
jgi:hypothetical protein